ncbi:lipase/acyltransferase domain-containing protein [Kitasatospora camelliae]|uniref:Lecithin:cholesterol acyltransferase n=1 Tax=Kitasatospora camelliae TaxID=3156397 RepID=A0AAU8K635_9ACTN
MKDVVVLLPGISGSVLKAGDRDLWAMSAGAVGRALLDRDGAVRRLTLSEPDDPDREVLADGIRATALMPDLHLLPGLDWRIDGYGRIDQVLRSTFDLRPGANYFPFPYDWRRDNRVHARRLARESRRWLAAWRESSGAADARLVLIGHSMGGLVARYFLECCEGWRDTRALITFGTPYTGSVNALRFLVNGYTKKLGPLPLADLTGALRSFTSTYQLLPTFRCVDNGGPELDRLRDLPLFPDWDAGKFAAAVSFHEEIEEAVRAHRASDYEGTGGYTIRPVVGEFQSTAQSAAPEGGRLRVMDSWRGVDQDGDGTVPRLSSFPKELFDSQHNVMFANQKHGSLQNDDAVLTQVHGLLKGAEVPRNYLAGLVRVGLRVDEVHLAGEPPVLQVRCDLEETALSCAVADAASGRTVVRVPVVVADGGWQGVEVPPLPAGDYRVTVGGGAGVASVTEVFTVLGEEPALSPSG